MRFLKRWFLRLFLLFLAAVLAYQLWIFGHVVYWNAYNPSSTAFMRDRLGSLQQKNPAATLRVRWVPYEQIAQSLKRAVIAAEDGKFPEHEGFDFDAMQKAYQKNLQKGRVVAGGSTISQQLAKNLFLSREKTPWAQTPRGRYHLYAGKSNVQTKNTGDLSERDRMGQRRLRCGGSDSLLLQHSASVPERGTIGSSCRHDSQSPVLSP